MHKHSITTFLLSLSFFSLSAYNHFDSEKYQPILGRQGLADLRCTQEVNQFPAQAPVEIAGEMPFPDGKGGMLLVPVQISIIYDIYGRPHLHGMKRVHEQLVKNTTKQLSLYDMTFGDVLVEVWGAVKKLAYAGAGSVVIVGKNVGPIIVSATMEALREVVAITTEALAEVVIGVAQGCSEALRDCAEVPQQIVAISRNQREAKPVSTEPRFAQLTDDEAQALAHLPVVKPSRIEQAL